MSETLLSETDLSRPGTMQEDGFKYTLLTGHNRTDGSFKTTDQLQMEYLHLTDELIRKITEGVEVINPDTTEREIRKPDTVIFLDKSARPVSWLMREMWDTYAADATGSIPEMPKIRYLNIDREQWVNSVDPNGNGMMDIEKVDDSVIRSLRSIFMSQVQKERGLTEELDTEPTSLDGKTVLVIDEVQSSGRTLDIATKILKRAFPSTGVAGEYWMGGLAAKVSPKTGGVSIGNADLPVWYRDDSEYGRGVANRLRDPSDSQSKNLTQKLGRWFLSTRFPEVDQSSLKLRKEMAQLAHSPDVPFRPSVNRELEDYEERLARLNGVSPEIAQKAIMNILHNS